MNCRNRKYKLMNVIRKSFGLTLLVIYCLSVLQYTIQIDHNHAHELAECNHNSSNQELDPCHRSTVHHDFENGCKHTTHYSSPIKHCSLCDLILHFDHLLVGLNYSHDNTDIVGEEIEISCNLNSGSEIFIQNRGPPNFS